MGWADFFKEQIKEISQKIFSPKIKKIKILSSIDTDSIVGAAFFVRTLDKLNYSFSCSFCKKINDNTVNEINSDISEAVVLINPKTSAEKINKINKKIIVIESISKEISEKATTISPQAFLQNLEVPVSALIYILCKELCKEITDISYLIPLGFFETDLDIPETLLNETIISKKLEIKKGITILSSQTLPIHRAIADTLCPYLPGISGSEDNAIKFLIENEIPVRENSKFKKLSDLNEEQTKRLLTAVMLKRLGSERSPEMVLGNTYIIISEDENSIIKDLKGFHYLIQACIAYGKPALALNICLNLLYKSKAYEFVMNSQVEIAKAMEYYLLNKKSMTIENPEITFIKMDSNLDYKFLNIFAKIVNNCNFLNSRLVGVIAFNPGGEALVQLEINNNDKRVLLELVKNLQNLIKFDADFGNNSIVLRVSQEEEEALLNKIVIASEGIKVGNSLKEL